MSVSSAIIATRASASPLPMLSTLDVHEATASGRTMSEQLSQFFIGQPSILEDLSVDAALQILVPMDRDGKEPAIGMLQDVVASE